MEVLLDSSFIVSCMLARIDFITELEEKGFKVVVPKEVVEELKDLKMKRGQSREVRSVVDAVLEMFEFRKIKKTSIGKGKVDEELIRKGKGGVFIATLDSGIKREVPNKVFILSSKKGIGVERS
jgi:rRNA-processing protein FCF1